MKRFLLTAAVVAGLISVSLPAQAQTTEINLSRDLVRLGIAAQNMEPNRPDLDSQPLFQAALNNVRSRGITRITADRGAYYFLTPVNSIQHLVLVNLSDLTIDLAGSDLYFRQSHHVGIALFNCQRITLANFTVDYLQLPFTQVRVTGVSATQRRVQYETLPGWQSPLEFNTIRNPFGSDEPLRTVIFRDGQALPGTSRFTVQRPMQSDSLQILDDNLAWTREANLARIRPGDTLVLTARAIGGVAVRVESGQNIRLSGIDVYASSVVGVALFRTSNSVVERVRVIPRPGTDRLISTNADGIHLGEAQENITVRLSRVSRTLDDGIAVNSGFLAMVEQQADSKTVTVRRFGGASRFPNGLNVSFLNRATGEIVTTARISSQTPPLESQQFTVGELVILTFDRDLPALVRDSGMVYADPANRGAGLLIENNLVEEVVFADGIAVAGIVNGIVRGNIVRRTNVAGIRLYEDMDIFLFAPNENLRVVRNTVEQAVNYGAVGAGIFASSAAIVAVTRATSPTTARPNKNIIVEDNYIADTLRSGVRLENVQGGSIRNNLLARTTLRPDQDAYGANAQTLAELGQPVVVKSSDGVAVAGNTVESATGAASIVSGASYANTAVAPDSLASLFGLNLAPRTEAAASLPLPTRLAGTTVTLTDSAGAVRPIPLVYASPGQINFLVPPETAPGAAMVTVSPEGGTLSRAAVLIDRIAPGLFSIDGNGRGLAAANLVRLLADGTQRNEAANFPVDLGPAGERVFLILYGTGFHLNQGLLSVRLRFGQLDVPVLYAGAQGSFAGLDQINVELPRSLQGAGVVDVQFSVEGVPANRVQIAVR